MNTNLFPVVLQCYCVNINYFKARIFRDLLRKYILCFITFYCYLRPVPAKSVAHSNILQYCTTKILQCHILNIYHIHKL